MSHQIVTLRRLRAASHRGEGAHREKVRVRAKGPRTDPFEAVGTNQIDAGPKGAGIVPAESVALTRRLVLQFDTPFHSPSSAVLGRLRVRVTLPVGLQNLCG
jgi:hypothetical protein